MTNGALMEEVRRILARQEEIPQRVANSMIMAAVVETYQNFMALESRILRLERNQEQDKIIDERNVTWPAIKDNLLMPTVRTAIVLALGYIFFKLTGVAP